MRIAWVSCLVVVAACSHKSKQPLPVRYHLGRVGPGDALSSVAHIEVLNQNALLVEYTREQLKGAQLTWVFETACGEKRSPPQPLPELGDVQTEVFVDAPETLDFPTVTTVLVDPQLTKKITIGSVVIDPKANPSTDVANIGCVSSFKVGDTEVAMPKLTKENASHAKYAMFVTDRPDECFVEFYKSYVKKDRVAPDVDEITGMVTDIPPEKLQGSRAYDVWGDFTYWFQPAPDEIEAKTDAVHQMRSGFDLCATYFASP